MTIKAQHITTQRDTGAWLSIDDEGNKGGMDVLDSPEFARYRLSMVRHILRERGDSTMVPVIVAAFAWPQVNQWGHNFEVEVQYTARWRAIYAGRITPEGLRDVQCYMD